MAHHRFLPAVLLICSSMTVMAGSIITPALPEISRFFASHPDWMVKLILTLPALVIALVAPFIGSLADRFGRRRLLLGSLAVYAAGGTAGVLVSDMGLMLLSRAVLGLGVAGIMSLVTTLIGDYYQGESRRKLMGLQGTFMALGGVVYLNMGGVLAEISWRGPFLVYLLALIILPFAIWLVYEPDRTPAAGEADLPPAPLPLWPVTGVYALGFFSMMSFYIMPVQFPFLVIEKTGLTTVWIGLAISLATLTAAAVGLIYGRLRSRPDYGLVQGIAFAGMGAGYVVMYLAESYGGLLLGCALGGLGGGLMMPNLNMWLMELAPSAMRGRIMGGYSSVFFMGQFMSPLVASPVIALWSLNGVFMVWALGLFAVAAGLLLRAALGGPQPDHT